MRKRFVLTAAAAAAAMLATLGPAGVSTAGAIPAVPGASGAQLWVARYNGPANGFDAARSVAVGPGGGRVFVTGDSFGRTTGDDYATVAYDAATGRRLWVARYNGPGNVGDVASSVVVSPDGTKVFVTGSSPGRTTGVDYATVAYSAATGRRLWVARYNGPGNGGDSASSVAVGPGGARVFVTGSSPGRTTGDDYATVAYSAVTGRQLWVRRYNGPRNLADVANSVAVSPGGARVFVTGSSEARVFSDDYATVAYDAATGRQLWVRRYNGPGNSGDFARSVAVGPGGTRVFVTGASQGRTTSGDYATVAYSAATGTQLWVRRYNGPGNGFDAARSVAVSPGGTRVFVTGSSEGRVASDDYATVAYAAATGRQLWVARYNGPGNSGDAALSLAVGPGGAKVFVTGLSVGRTTGSDYATVAYSAAIGTQLWVRRYNGPGNGHDVASSVAVGPGGARVFVTGESQGRTSDFDYATVAYRG
jgi:WD40 repeat protein